MCVTIIKKKIPSIKRYINLSGFFYIAVEENVDNIERIHFRNMSFSKAKLKRFNEIQGKKKFFEQKNFYFKFIMPFERVQIENSR